MLYYPKHEVLTYFQFTKDTTILQRLTRVLNSHAKGPNYVQKTAQDIKNGEKQVKHPYPLDSINISQKMNRSTCYCFFCPSKTPTIDIITENWLISVNLSCYD